MQKFKVGGDVMAKLSDKQKVFCDEYLIDLNATQAAIRAGYSPRTAKDIGTKLLNNIDIQKHMYSEKVINEIAKIAFYNPNVINYNTAQINNNANENDLCAIQSIKVKSTITKDGKSIEREIKMHDKLRALELLGMHLELFDKKTSAVIIDDASRK